MRTEHEGIRTEAMVAMSESARIDYIGRSDKGRHIEAVVVPAIDSGSLVPDHPEYGDADRESKRRIDEVKERTRRASKHPLKRRRTK